jgi:hypothetical protein
MTSKPKTVLTIVVGALVAVTPALLGYLENREEIKAKYRAAQESASGGYEALSASVKELQKAVATQHDYIVRLEAHIEYMDKYVLESINRVASTPVVVGTPRPQLPRDPVKTAPKPPTGPRFDDLPDDIGQAAKQFQAKH